MAQTQIEWTGFVWNFMLGCSKCSPGCENCYAISDVGRERCTPHKGLAVLSPVPNWTGLLRFRPESLDAPLRRTKPTKWFVNSLSDFFHEAAVLDWQMASLEVMRLADWHIFQVLTKRHHQLQSLLTNDCGHTPHCQTSCGVSAWRTEGTVCRELMPCARPRRRLSG
jgi:protein gp37